jgi:hypothetical protein
MGVVNIGAIIWIALHIYGAVSIASPDAQGEIPMKTRGKDMASALQP